MIKTLIMIVSMVSIVHVKQTMPTESMTVIKDYANHQVMDKHVTEIVVNDESEEVKDLSKDKIEKVTTQFIDHLVQEVDDEYRVLNYKTIHELKNSISSLASEKVVNQFVDFYYYEKEGQLYIVPTSTPPWFEPENDYKVKRVEENIFEVEQANQSEYHGDYTIVFLIRLNEADEPFIIDVNYL